MRDDLFPRESVGTHQEDLILMDIYPLNYHINHDKWDWFKMFDPAYAHRLTDHFDNWDTDEWNVSESGSGPATQALTDMVNGVLLITTDTPDDDNVEITKVAEAWKLVDNYPLYAEIRFKVDDAEQIDFWFGLITGATWFTAPNDYVVFKKDDGDQNIDFVTCLNGNATDEDTGQDLEDDEWIRLGFHWDGDGHVRYFVFRDSDRYCLQTGRVTTNVPQDEELAIGFGIQNGEAAEKNLWVDYIKCVQKLVIE